MTCFVAGDDSRPRIRLGIGGTAGSRFGAALRAYLRSRSRKRASAQFGAVDLHTLKDIGLLRTHIAAACVSEDNDNDRDAVARPVSNGGSAPKYASP